MHAVMHLFSIGDEEVGRIRDGELTPRCKAEVGGKIVPFIIDSGAAANIVSGEVYDQIKHNVVLERPSKKLYAFGQSMPLNMSVQG